MSSYVRDILSGYDLDNLSIATLASHSSLQIVHGAKKEGFRTLLVVTDDRLWFYRQFKHLVDVFVIVKRWSELCSEDVVRILRERNSIFVPHGSFVEYVGMECATRIPVPIFGLRSLFPVEADQHAKMRLLSSAGIPIPRVYSVDEEPDRLVMVKLPGAKGGRGYFVASSKEEIALGLRKLLDEGVVRDVSSVMVQEYLIGVTAYFHYFYSPVLERLEITGADIRYESDVDGLRRMPVKKLLELGLEPTFTVVGNIPVVLRESIMPVIMDYGARFVEATKTHLPPGVIGPFCLEAVIGRDTGVKVFEFSGRIVAGTNLYIDGSPYTYLYWDEPMSVGRRISREVKLALEKRMLDRVVT